MNQIDDTRPFGRIAFETAKRLFSDERGNALIIATAVMIPLLGLVGSGIDLSRTYLARNKLQQACDAGVIAGRKVYVNSVNSTVIDEVRKYVNFNFPQLSNDTTAFAINPAAGEDNAVNLALATNVNMSVMKIFGFETLPISANCTGRQDFINTDVMLVLDTTLSMNCLPPTAAGTYCPSEQSGSKIQGLRTAVTNFFTSLVPAQTQLEAAGLRLRYGIVPYSMTVNTGKLIYAKNPAYMRASPQYQQCTLSGANCGSNPVSFNTVPRNAAWYSSASWAGCIEERQTVKTINASSGYTVPSGARDLDIDTAPTSDTSTQWSPYDPASATAKSGPVADGSYDAGLENACPAAAVQLRKFNNAADMQTEVNKLTAGGYTYHDIGMLWGARLFSRGGIWASDNPASFNSFPVNRHLIFMTDGTMEPSLNSYTAYGIEKYATGGQRVTPSGAAAAQLASHTQRFRMLCNKVKSMNVSLWVVAFGTAAGTGLTQDLKDCASNPGQAFSAADSASLTAKFQQISQSIGALRLSQ